MLPYWRRVGIDSTQDGYRLHDMHRTWRDALGALRSRLGGRTATPHGPSSSDKHLVSQSRLLYVFSLAHRLGYGHGGQHYLDSARHGYRFLRDRMRDQEHGGYSGG